MLVTHYVPNVGYSENQKRRLASSRFQRAAYVRVESAYNFKKQEGAHIKCVASSEAR